MVRTSDSWSRGLKFDSQRVCSQVTTLGNLFTAMCLLTPSGRAYNMVPAKGQRRSAAGKVTGGLVESHVNLMPGLSLHHRPAGWLPRDQDQLQTLCSYTEYVTSFTVHVVMHSTATDGYEDTEILQTLFHTHIKSATYNAVVRTSDWTKSSTWKNGLAKGKKYVHWTQDLCSTLTVKMWTTWKVNCKLIIWHKLAE